MVQLADDYKKRSIRFLEIWQKQGWRMKVYGISYQGGYPRKELVETARTLALQTVPFPAVKQDRYGVGFIGVHDGKDSDFIFIDWWSNENELNHHVYISKHGEKPQFEYCTPKGLIACTWDLKVLNFERDCWVMAVLNNPAGTPDIEQYLQYHMNEDF